MSCVVFFELVTFLDSEIFGVQNGYSEVAFRRSPANYVQQEIG